MKRETATLCFVALRRISRVFRDFGSNFGSKITGRGCGTVRREQQPQLNQATALLANQLPPTGDSPKTKALDRMWAGSSRGGASLNSGGSSSSSFRDRMRRHETEESGMPRPPIGERAMTAAERQRKRRQEIIDTTPKRPAPEITKAEQAELQKLINRREKVLRQVAAARSADLMADFEQQMAAEYSFDDRDVWAEATRRGRAAVDEANQKIAEECALLGIPSQFAPCLAFGWSSRGENASKERRTELRRVAQTRIEAIEKRALVEISHEALLASTEIVSLGLVSEAAQRFLNELAPLERLMPPLDFHSIEDTLIGKPIMSQYGSETGRTFERLTVEPTSEPLSKEEAEDAEIAALRDEVLSRNS
jgi:hypothetical protein